MKKEFFSTVKMWHHVSNIMYWFGWFLPSSFQTVLLMVSVFIDENTSRLEYVWTNYTPCLFVYVCAVRDCIDTVRGLSPCDLHGVPCNE